MLRAVPLEERPGVVRPEAVDDGQQPRDGLLGREPGALPPMSVCTQPGLATTLTTPRFCRSKAMARASMSSVALLPQ